MQGLKTYEKKLTTKKAIKNTTKAVKNTAINIEAYIPHHGAYKPEKEGFHTTRIPIVIFAVKGLSWIFQAWRMIKDRAPARFVTEAKQQIVKIVHCEKLV
ncbi:hypothetical protein AGMMS49525_05470 [Bacteroidia bacterium]|nr:hypothetical protein AGMMS49525_05470 [Bacteroidia bacterium]